MKKSTLSGIIIFISLFLFSRQNLSAQTSIAPLTNYLLACGNPTNLSVNNITTSSVLISWSAVSTATSYTIQYRRSGITTWTSSTTSNTSKTLTNLSSSSTYEFKIRSTCPSGAGSYSPSSHFSTLNSCQSPSGLVASSISSTTENLSWTNITGIMYFNFRYRISGTTTWTNDSSLTNSKTVSGLLPSTIYNFQVQTRCSAGILSPFGSTSTFTTAVATVACGIPNVALFGTINITSSSANVYWSAISGAVSYIVQYRVYGSTSSFLSVNSTTPSASISGLNATTSYEFKVQSVCSSGSSAFSQIGIFTTTAAFTCGIPLTATFSSTAITSNSCSVGWGSVSGAVGYKVQYRVNGSGATWNLVSVTTNSVTLTGLLATTGYEFQVQTTCSTGSSAFSASGIFTTTAPSCGVPDVAFFSSTNKTASSCTVGWSAVTGATGYNVRYRVNLSSNAWSTVSSTATSINLTSLLASTQYEFQVQTLCAAGTGAYSASGVFTTTAVTGCGTASGFSATNITTTSATLNWTAVSGALSYSVQYRKTGTTTWISGTSSVSSISVTGLLSSNAYEFQVQTICASNSSAYTASFVFTTTGTGAAVLPVPDHIVVVVFENHSYAQIIGNAAAPRLNALAIDPMSTLFTESYGLVHPSQPNYLHLFAGGNQGVTTNNMPSSHFTTMNLAKALLNVGRTFNYYCEDLPSIGSDVEFNLGYARKHNALANWMGTGTNQVSGSMNLPFTSFPTDFTTLPTVSFVSPNLANSMHDGVGNAAITVGDNWFYSRINAYAQWAKTHNSLLIITFDEDDNISSNHIATIFTGQMVTQGQNATGISHHNILRTIEDMYGLVHSGNAANVAPIHGCWTNGYRLANVPEVSSDLSMNVYPNPVVDNLSIQYTLTQKAIVSLRLFSVLGKLISSENFSSQEPGVYDHSISIASLNLNGGIYFVEISVNETRTIRRIVVE